MSLPKSTRFGVNYEESNVSSSLWDPALHAVAPAIATTCITIGHALYSPCVPEGYVETETYESKGNPNSSH